MKKHLLVICISILFLISALIPITLGHDIKVPEVNQIKSINSKHDTPPMKEWNKTYNIRGEGNCVQETPDDCYIVAGTCGGGYWWDVFLLKVDAEGNELWNCTFGSDDNGSSIDLGNWVEVTDDEGYVVVGRRDFPNDTRGSRDIWLIKTDANGNELWNKTYAGQYDDEGSCVKQTIDGGYIFTGIYNSKLCLFKTDEYGDELWNKTYGDEYGWGHSIQQTNDNGYIITGTYENDPGYLWILKTDINGTLEWEKKIPSEPGYCYYNCGNSVEQTNDNGFIIGGYTDSYGNGKTDYWIVKLNNNGDEEWNKTFGGSDWDRSYNALQTSDSGYIIGGYKDWPVKFWLVRTNGYGQVIWDEVYFPSERGRCYCVQQTKDNGYIATGTINQIFGSPHRCVLVKLGPDVQNHPPSKPLIDGPTQGKVGVEYTYTFNATDEDGNWLKYYVDWGDGTEDETDIFPNATIVSLSHSWDTIGIYMIRAKAIDDFGSESDWENLTVTIPRDKAVTGNKLLLRIFCYSNEFWMFEGRL